MKYLSFFIFLFTSLLIAQPNLFNQSYDEVQDFGLSENEIKDLRSRGELVIFNEEKHETKIAKDLFKKRVGKSVKQKQALGVTTYTVVADAEIPHYRMNYIFIDGNKMNPSRVDNMVKTLRKLLDDDIQFEAVARQYSMDYNGRRGGDSGWFKQQKAVPEFFDATNRPKLLANEIFEVSLEEANWFYIVKKTYSSTNIREILVLVERE